MHKCMKNVANVAQEATLNQLNNESPVMKYWTSVSFEWNGHKSGQRCILLVGTPANLLGGDLETPSKSMADYELWQSVKEVHAFVPRAFIADLTTNRPYQSSHNRYLGACRRAQADGLG